MKCLLESVNLESGVGIHCFRNFSFGDPEWGAGRGWGAELFVIFVILCITRNFRNFESFENFENVENDENFGNYEIV